MTFLGMTAASLAFPPCAEGVTPAGTRIQSAVLVTTVLKGVPYAFPSNPARVTVAQAASVSVDPPRTAAVLPGGTTTFAHTVTNRGNFPDLFAIEATAPADWTVTFFGPDGVTPLADTNGDGAVDTPLLPSGATFPIFVKVTTASTAPPGTVGKAVVRLRSTADREVSTTLADAATIISPTFWPFLENTVQPLGPVRQGTLLTYTITFGSDPATEATNVVISDPLDPGLRYIDGSAVVPPALAGVTVNYDPILRTISWTIPRVPPGYRGPVSFRAQVIADTASDTLIANIIKIVSDQNPVPQLSPAADSPVVEQPLLVTVTPGRGEGEAGDAVWFTVSVENSSRALTANAVQLVDTLPKGFRYAKGSSRLEKARIADPLPGAPVVWEIGPLGPGEKKSLVFGAAISTEAPLGEAVNSVLARGTSPAGYRLLSPTVSTRVRVREGVLNDRSIILGRIFVDRNGDLMPDRDEPGAKGVRVCLENGFFAITDDEGKFSLVGVDSGEHVLKLDRTTLPPGHEPVPLDSSFAGDGGSRFIHIPFGGSARGDFGLVQVKKEEAPRQVEEKPPSPPQRVFHFGAALNPPPRTLEQQIGTMPDTPEILQPLPGTVLGKKWTDIVVRIPEGARYTLRVNDLPLLQEQIGKTIVESRRKIRICQYIGVKLQPGVNRVVLEVVREGAIVLKEVEVVARGAAARLKVTPATGSVPADGKSAIPFKVTLVDAQGREAEGDAVYTVTAEKGEVAEPDLDPSLPGHQLKAVDGKGEFHLRATSKTGADRVAVAAGTDLKESAEVFFTPAMREWIVTGLGSLTVGENGVSGNRGNLPSRVRAGLYDEERLAFFAKGSLRDDYLVTAAYDSRKREEPGLFQRIEPNRYYPVYGDASLQGYDAESRTRYYLKVEKDRSSLLVGDFNTSLSANEFSRYDRSFNGARADIQTKNATLRAFGTSTSRAANRDEIPGNGTSGYYFLTRKPVVENTDRVRIEVRDRYHTERVLSAALKAPYTDYSLDVATGAILFREPVPSYDENLNPVRIVVLYESDDPGNDYYIYGGRGAIRSERGAEVGVTAVVDETGQRTGTLYGIDAQAPIGARTTVTMEGARTDTAEKGEGVAWKTEVASRFEKTAVDAYYRRVGRNFLNPSMSGNETGTEKYGAKVIYSLLEKTKLTADGFVQSDLNNRTRLTNTSLGVSRQLSRFTLDAGVRFLKGDDDAGRRTSSGMGYAGVSGKVTERLEGALIQEQAVGSDTVKDYPSRTVLKASYRLSEKTSAFVTEEFKESGKYRGSNTLAGITHKVGEHVVLTTSYLDATGVDPKRQVGSEVNTNWDPSRELSFTTKTGYQIQNSLSGDRGQALLGVGSNWEALPGLRLGVKAERVQVVTGNNDPTGVNTALALSAEYLGMEGVKATGRYEFRLSPGETANLYSLGGAWKLTRSVTLLGKGSYWSSEKPTGTDVLIDAEAGGAFRPLGRDSLYLLGVIRFKDDRKGSTPTGDELKSVISSAEFTWLLRSNLTVHGKYAGKYSWGSLLGNGIEAYSDLVLAGAAYGLTERWDLDVSAKLANQYDGGLTAVGVIPEVGYRVVKNVRVAAGYNFSRLNDRDLAGEGYSAAGPFLQLKFKFDERTVQELRKRPTPKPAAAPPPAPRLPAPKPVVYLVRSELSEEPVVLLGSAEALKVLVNDHEPSFAAVDAQVAVGNAGQVVELSPEEPPVVSFEVEPSAPGVLSWTLTIAGVSGGTEKRLEGRGTPPPLVEIDLRDDRTGAFPTAGIYRYRIEAVHADGSRSSGPERLFALYRKRGEDLTLSGAAFTKGSANLAREARVLLGRSTVALRRVPDGKIVVEGHCAALPDGPEGNLWRRRGSEVADYLVRHEGLPRDRVVFRWLGTTRPVASVLLPQAASLNARVVVRGEWTDVERTDIVDQPRVSPFVRVNGSPVALDPAGRFSHPLSNAGRVELEMGNGEGRSLRAEFPLPKLTLLDRNGVIRLPLPEGRQSGSVTHRFNGKAEPGDRLTVNGREVPVAADGSFSFTADLAEGATTYWLQLRNRGGVCSNYRLVVSVAREKETAVGGGKEKGTGSGKP